MGTIRTEKSTCIVIMPACVLGVPAWTGLCTSALIGLVPHTSLHKQSKHLQEVPDRTEEEKCGPDLCLIVGLYFPRAWIEAIKGWTTNGSNVLSWNIQEFSSSLLRPNWTFSSFSPSLIQRMLWCNPVSHQCYGPTGLKEKTRDKTLTFQRKSVPFSWNHLTSPVGPHSYR